MKEIIQNFRYIGRVAIICSFFGCLLIFIIGALKTCNAFNAAIPGKIPQISLSHLNTGDETEVSWTNIPSISLA